MTLQAKTQRRESETKEQAIAEVSAEPTRRLNVEIPTTLHRRIKMASVMHDTTIMDLVTDALEEYLDKSQLELRNQKSPGSLNGTADCEPTW